ncbi:Endonuclease/exonuclease/phosphatase [Gymnopilus junonius]|uniref:Endonuclease/exonuclease/phosphatase n=1 Tax=Gymnopilus junonius TaxID=109634 RepID=A0A9P5TTG0_GYMJU|nr:Endonuclease/exonuclease/phosphatase [Gymnopilus junonius]
MAYSYWPPRFGGFHVPRWGPGPQPKPSQNAREEVFEPFIPPPPNEIMDPDEDEDQPNVEPVPVVQNQNPQRRVPEQLLTIRPYRFRWSKSAWKHVVPSGMSMREISQIRIITWNVDMVSDYHEERLTAALRHIEEDALKCKEDEEPEPCCILLQEVRDFILPYLLKDPWVRKHFVVAPFTKDKWPEGAWYGNVTLVSRSIEIAECHILHYAFSRMQRTALCVKIKLNFRGSKDKAIISIVNTHLESLPDGAAARPKQLAICARFLLLEQVSGGIVAGDMNAIGPGMKCWRKGDIDAGKTWGYQGQNSGNYPPNRLDKIFLLPGGYKVEEPKRIGVGLRIKEDTNDAVWVSDHYGLETTLRMKARSTSSE